MQHLSVEELNQQAARLRGVLEKHGKSPMTSPHVEGAAASNKTVVNNGCNNDHDDDHINSTSNGYYYLNDGARTKLPLYEYRGSDLSLLYKFILSPLAEWCVDTLLPTTMAPNTVTLIGLMGMISSYGLYWWHVPNLQASVQEELPRWIFLYNAIAMLLYQTLDNMDGKQARRTKSSSPLGLLFDHGCDAINSIFGSSNWIIGMALLVERDQWQIWALVFGPFAMFFVATWEQYYTGQLMMPVINGPNEGLMGGVLLSLVSFWWGPRYWQETTWFERLRSQETLSFPWSGWLLSEYTGTPLVRNCDFVIVAASIGFLQEIVWKSVVVISRYQKEGAGQALLPFLSLAGCFWVIGLHQPDLLMENPRTSLHLAMFLFVEMSTELMLAHVTAQRFLPFQRWQLLPLIVLALWTVLLGDCTNGDKITLLPEQSYFLTAYTWSMGTYWLMKCVLVIREICAVLQIWCFDIVTAYRTKQLN
jgi:ethanolaminephosphotransferase